MLFCPDRRSVARDHSPVKDSLLAAPFPPPARAEVSLRTRCARGCDVDSVRKLLVSSAPARKDTKLAILAWFGHTARPSKDGRRRCAPRSGGRDRIVLRNDAIATEREILEWCVDRSPATSGRDRYRSCPSRICQGP